MTDDRGPARASAGRLVAGVLEFRIGNAENMTI